MKTKCSHCGQKYDTREEYSGQLVECGQCGKSFQAIPEVSPSADLLTCKVRGGAVSRNASACQHCGDPMRAVMQKPAPAVIAKPNTLTRNRGCADGLIIMIILAIVGGFILFSSNGQSSKANPRAAQEEEMKSAWYAARELVTQTLKSPSSAKFPVWGIGPIFVSILGNDEYQVSSYVDSQNQSGAMTRSNFSIRIKKINSGQSWQRVTSIEQ